MTARAAHRRGQSRQLGADKAPLLALPDQEGLIYVRLYQHLRELISSGHWAADTRLPSSRTLARDLGVSRSTVMTAIEQLIAEGWAEARDRSGVYVTRMRVRSGKVEPSTGLESPPADPEWSTAPLGDAALPRLRASYSQVLGDSTELLRKPARGGSPRLRAAIASQVCASRGIVVDPSQIIVVPSAIAALDLLGRVLARPGVEAVVEEPGNPRLAGILQHCGYDVRSLPVDRYGLDPTLLAEIRPGGLCVVSTSPQWPTGAIMSKPRRTALLAWASRQNGWIVEDDTLGQACPSQGSGGAPLKSSRNADRVIYVRDFAQLLYAGLRVAFMVAPQELVPALLDAQEQRDLQAGGIEQLALARFIEDGFFAAHVRSARSQLEKARADLARELAESHLGSFGAQDGYPTHFGLRLPLPVADRIADRLRDRSIAALSWSHFCPGSRHGDRLLISLAGLRAGAGRIVADAVRSELETESA